MSLFLGTVDKKKITGRQGRAIHKTSHLYPTCYFPDYGNNLKVEVDTIISNQINLLSGCGLIDGTVVEENTTSTVTVNDPGDYKAYIEVNLSNDNNPTVSFGVTTSALIQDDLTINKNGIHQGELATFTFSNDGVSNLINTLQNGDTVEVLNKVLDNRYKRIVDINNEFSDSDFANMNMAQIMKYITDFIGSWNYTYEVVGECTDFTPKVGTAMRSMVNEIFRTNITTSTFKFKMNRPRRSGLSGGDILEVGFNNGPMFYIQYDNFGPNWATVNNEAFKPAEEYYGKLVIEEISSQDGTTNIKNNLKLDGTLYCDGQTRVLGGDFLTPFFHESSLTAVADETTLIKQNYNNGNASMTLGNLKAVSSERTFTNLTKFDTTGAPNRAILIFSSTASDAGVIHQVGETNHKLAYNTDITREALQKDNEYLPLLVEMQTAIDSIQGLRSDSELLTILKMKQTKAEEDLIDLEKQYTITFAEEDLLQLQTDLADVRNIIIEMEKAINSIQELDGNSNLINRLKSRQEQVKNDLADLKQKELELETQILVKELELETIKEE